MCFQGYDCGSQNMTSRRLGDPQSMDLVVVEAMKDGYEMWDRMPGTGTEVPTIGEFLAVNPVPRHLVPHSPSWSLHRPGL